VEKQIQTVLVGERTHQADAKDFSRQWTKTGCDLDPMLFEQGPPNQRFVDPLRNPNGVEIRDAMVRRRMHAQTQGFDALDKLSVRMGVPLETLLEAFVEDRGQPFAQRIEVGNRRGVMIFTRVVIIR